MKRQRHNRKRRETLASLSSAIPADQLSSFKALTAWASWQRWAVRLCLMLLGPLLVLLLAEGGLRLVGYGYPVTFFLRAPAGDHFVTNQRFAWPYFDHRTVLKPLLGNLSAPKAPGSLRLCVLGESAAMGTPDPAFSFGRILEIQLAAQFPHQRFEIINAAMRGINSHVIRTIAAECARHEVDVFLVYMGNNEVVGVYGPEPGTPLWMQSRHLIRASHWLKTTKLGQVFQSALERTAKPSPTQDMAYFRAHSLRPDDERRELNRANFRANLQDILRAAQQSGGKVLLATVGANLKDFPPLQSLHRAGLSADQTMQWEQVYQQGIGLETRGHTREAIAKYKEAAGIDDHFADLHFRLARCYFEAGDFAEAKTHYGLARDWDAMQFRGDSRLNALIREVAGSSPDVRLLDLEQAFAASDLSDRGVPGAKLFADHVHPTFAGNYLIARRFGAEIASLYAAKLGKPARAEVPNERECAQALAYTEYDDLNVEAAMLRLTAMPPFLDQIDHAKRQAEGETRSKKRLEAFDSATAEQCLQTYRAALKHRPQDWLLHHNLAILCQELRLYPEAAEHFALAAKKFPGCKRFRIELANALQGAGEKTRAAAEYAEALRLDPDDKQLEDQLARANPR